MRCPALVSLVLAATACGGGGSGGDAADDVDATATRDGAPAADGAPLADGRVIPAGVQNTCNFRLRFDASSSTFEGECRAYTPVEGSFEGRFVGPCVFTADSSGAAGNTDVLDTGTITVTGTAGSPITATADGNQHYSRGQAAVIAAVGDSITMASSGGAVPAIPSFAFTRPTDLSFATRPSPTVSRAAGWTLAYGGAPGGRLRVTISQNMSSIFLKAICTAPSTDASLTIPAEVLTPFFYGDAFAQFEALGTNTATAGAFSVEAAAVGAVTAEGAPFTGMAVFLDD